MHTIDAHQHYWTPSRGDYHWMPQDNPILARSYGPADLAPELAAHGIERTVLVQAAATVHETEYMLGLADATPSIAAVVGWVDFERPVDRAHLRRLAQHPKMVGIRPMIQDIPDPDWMLRDDVQWGFRATAELGLSFDALGFPQHLANFLTILQRYPDLRVVIDHGMKPQIGAHTPTSFQHWADGISRIAQETSACCKLSGLVTETDADCRAETLRPYAKHILTAFGPDRVMWGSDWPVCRLRCEYSHWHNTARTLTSHLPTTAQAQVFGGTAAMFYQLE